MKAFPGKENFDPCKMDPAQMKILLNLFSGIPDAKLKIR